MAGDGHLVRRLCRYQRRLGLGQGLRRLGRVSGPAYRACRGLHHYAHWISRACSNIRPPPNARSSSLEVHRPRLRALGPDMAECLLRIFGPQPLELGLRPLMFEERRSGRTALRRELSPPQTKSVPELNSAPEFLPETLSTIKKVLDENGGGSGVRLRGRPRDRRLSYPA
jgi:hypothetical protein